MTSLLEMVSGGIEKPLILAYCGATIKEAGGCGATAPARRACDRGSDDRSQRSRRACVTTLRPRC